MKRKKTGGSRRGSSGKSKSGKPQSGCFLIVFGTIFLAAGIGMLVYGSTWWMFYWGSEHWVTARATLHHVEFKTHRSRDSEGRSSTSYSVECQYTYDYEGQTYEGNRVGVSTTSSSSSHHRKQYEFLRVRRAQRKPIDVYVNPDDPSESVIFRDVTGDMYILPVMGLVFSAVGFGITGGTTYVRRRYKRQVKRMAEDPQRPWRAAGLWDGFVGRAAIIKNLAIAWGVAIGLGLFMSIFWVAFGSAGNAPIFALILVGLFTLAPIGMLIYAVYLTFVFVKFGRPHLLLAQVPIVPGEEFVAMVVVGKRLGQDTPIDVELRCVEKYRREGSGRTNYGSETIHTVKQTASEEMAERGSRIPIVMTVPTGFPTRQDLEYPKYFWQLHVKAAMAGIDFQAEFDLPVYAVEDASLIERNAKL